MTNKTALQAVNELSREMSGPLQEMCAKLGFKSLKVGRGKYDPHTGFFSVTVEGVVEGGSSKDETNYKFMRQIYPDLPEINKSFTYMGKTYMIVGANSRYTKVLANTGGKTYLFTPEHIKAVMAINGNAKVVVTPISILPPE